MANIAELSGDEREQRAAELKRKMQEAAKRTKSAQNEAPVATPPAAVVATPAAPPVAASPAPVAEAATVAVVEAPVAATASVEAVTVDGEPVVVAEAPVATNGNGTAVAAMPAAGAVIAAPPRPAPATPAEVDPEAAAKAQMNRREFLTYAWGAALGLLTLQGGVASFLFLYPRFRAGEFGGDFFKAVTDFGDPTTEPAGDTTGKFWMVTTQEGTPKAIYMVCTHLGCLYKWVSANNRFECPCHGSKFSHDGFYIEGPAPRSLDYFETTVEGGQIAVHTGRKTNGSPAAESPARAVPA